MDIEARSQEIDTRIKDILVRLENLKIAFDKKNEIFRQEMNIFELNKKRVLDSSKKQNPGVNQSFEELEDYVVGLRKNKKK